MQKNSRQGNTITEKTTKQYKNHHEERAEELGKQEHRTPPREQGNQEKTHIHGRGVKKIDSVITIFYLEILVSI